MISLFLLGTVGSAASWALFLAGRNNLGVLGIIGGGSMVAGLVGMASLFLAALAAIPVVAGAALVGASLLCDPAHRPDRPWARALGVLLVLVPVGIGVVVSMGGQSSESGFEFISWVFAGGIGLVTVCLPFLSRHAEAAPDGR